MEVYMKAQFSLTPGFSNNEFPQIDIKGIISLIQKGTLGPKVMLEFEEIRTHLEQGHPQTFLRLLVNTEKPILEHLILNSVDPLATDSEPDSLKEKLARPYSTLKFPEGSRIPNLLANMGVKSLRDIVSKSDADFLSTRNFGRKCLDNLKQVLGELQLNTGMKRELERLEKI